MIIFDKTTKFNADNRPILEDISLQINPGEFVLLTGHSGAGKTTLMRLLIREYTPDKGEVSFFEQPLSKLARRHLPKHRRRIGVIFQDYKLLPELTVWENLALPLQIIGQRSAEIQSRIDDLLELVELPHLAWHFPSQLSGGEAQRMSIARALAVGPDVIFADEPTGNLDAETSAGIAKLLQKINELGTTTIFATHDTDLIKHFAKKRHVILEKGKVVADSATKKTSKLAAKEHDQSTTEKPNPESTDQKDAPKDTASKAKKTRFGSWWHRITSKSDQS